MRYGERGWKMSKKDEHYGRAKWKKENHKGKGRSLRTKEAEGEATKMRGRGINGRKVQYKN